MCEPGGGEPGVEETELPRPPTVVGALYEVVPGTGETGLTFCVGGGDPARTVPRGIPESKGCSIAAGDTTLTALPPPLTLTPILLPWPDVLLMSSVLPALGRELIELEGATTDPCSRRNMPSVVSTATGAPSEPRSGVLGVAVSNEEPLG